MVERTKQMKHQIRLRRRIRYRALIGWTSALSAIAALGLAFSPVVAQASTTLSASAQGWGSTWDSAIPNAEANADHALFTQAQSLGETCTGITYTSSLYYIVPGGGGYVFVATATGQCAPG
jgi:hypothetical protein